MANPTIIEEAKKFSKKLSAGLGGYHAVVATLDSAATRAGDRCLWAARIDTSSDDDMRSSIQRVRTSLSDDRRARFDEALVTIGMSGVATALADKTLADKPPNREAMGQGLRSALNGKTADEVIAEGERIAKSGILEQVRPRSIQ